MQSGRSGAHGLCGCLQAHLLIWFVCVAVQSAKGPGEDIYSVVITLNQWSHHSEIAEPITVKHDNSSTNEVTPTRENHYFLDGAEHQDANTKDHKSAVTGRWCGFLFNLYNNDGNI